MVEHGGWCGDGADKDCPICRGEPLPSEFVTRVEIAAAQPGRVMTRDDFEAWLDSF